MALSTSASSGLTTSRRSASVLDGAIWSSGTSSPVLGSRYCTRLWWAELGQFLDADAGGAQDLHDRPGPERVAFSGGQVAACDGARVIGADRAPVAGAGSARRRAGAGAGVRPAAAGPAGPGEGEDLTRDKSDPKDAVLIARLAGERRCYEPERAGCEAVAAASPRGRAAAS